MGSRNGLFMYITIIKVFLIITALVSGKCSNDSPPILKYFLIEKCHRSTLGIAAKANFTSLISCQGLGIEKKALSLNFSPQTGFIDDDPLEYTCEVLKCAETEGGISLYNDTRYDYYSLYGKPLPNINSTCVPAIGMFHILPEKLNYSQAQSKCNNINGTLAHVTSEQRTDALAQVLVTSNVEAAYVGMWRTNNSVFHTSNGDVLDWTTYRAWAPGHPGRRLDGSCVILTRHRTWKTSACNKRFHAICELIPAGPYKKGSIFAYTKINGTRDP